MKALTVRQPWAWAILHGGKDVENRTQAWSYRGPLAIHAGAEFSDRGMDLVPDIVAAEREVPEDEVRAEMAEAMTFGAILGVVDLVDVHHGESACCESWWAETGYVEVRGRVRRDIVHLVLENPVALPVPVVARGSLGLWNVPDDIERQIALSMKAA